jgi:hypothetical protein
LYLFLMNLCARGVLSFTVYLSHYEMNVITNSINKSWIDTNSISLTQFTEASFSLPIKPIDYAFIIGNVKVIK